MVRRYGRDSSRACSSVACAGSASYPPSHSPGELERLSLQPWRSRVAVPAPVRPAGRGRSLAPSRLRRRRGHLWADPNGTVGGPSLPEASGVDRRRDAGWSARPHGRLPRLGTLLREMKAAGRRGARDSGTDALPCRAQRRGEMGDAPSGVL